MSEVFFSCLKQSFACSMIFHRRYRYFTNNIQNYKQVLAQPVFGFFAENARPKQKHCLSFDKIWFGNINERNISKQACVGHDFELCQINSAPGVAVGKILVTPTPTPVKTVDSDRLRLRLRLRSPERHLRLVRGQGHHSPSRGTTDLSGAQRPSRATTGLPGAPPATTS